MVIQFVKAFFSDRPIENSLAESTAGRQFDPFFVVVSRIRAKYRAIIFEGLPE